jgi:hypothetical protein
MFARLMIDKILIFLQMRFLLSSTFVKVRSNEANLNVLGILESQLWVCGAG